MLLAPVASQLGNRRLLIVAPGALQYVPFGALPAVASPSSQSTASIPLIANHEIINLPSASVLSVLRREFAKRQSASQSVAVLADPVFSEEDARVKAAVASGQKAKEADIATSALKRAIRGVIGDERAGLRRLLFSRDEAEAIVSLAPASSVLKALDFKANRAMALSDQLSQYRIIHFATHGLLDSANPELSGLALSLVDESGKEQDGYLRLNEIYNLKIIAVAQGNTPKEIPEILKTKLITDVQKDTGFVVDENNPETVLKFTVTAFDVEFRSGTRQSGNSTIPFTMVNGNIEVSYQAIESKTNAPVDSENLVDNLKQDYPPSSSDKRGLGGLLPSFTGILKGSDPNLTPSQSEVRNFLVNSIVKQMAQRAAPVEERFTVQLPLGKLEQLSRVAQTQSWGKVREGAETMAPFPKEADDSYRIYLVGLANEAAAYEQTTNDATRDYLFKARTAYDQCRTKNPGEKYFIEPWTRVDKAVTQYDKIKRQAAEYQQYVATKSGRAVTPPAQPKPVPAQDNNTGRGNSSDGAPAVNSGGSSDVWNNQTILQFWKSGVTEPGLIEYVKMAEKHNFDVASPAALKELIDAKVPPAVIRAMRAKASTGKPSGGRPGSGTRPKKP